MFHIVKFHCTNLKSFLIVRYFDDGDCLLHVVGNKPHVVTVVDRFLGVDLPVAAIPQVVV